MEEGLNSSQFTSKIPLPHLGVSLHTIPRNRRQILYDDSGPHFSHAPKVHTLSKVFSTFQTLKEDLSLLCHVRTVLRVTAQHQNLMKATSSLCDSLSKMPGTIETSKISQTLVLDLIERVKECTDCTFHLSNLLQSHMSERHSGKTKIMLVEFNYMAINSLRLETVVKYIRTVIGKLVCFRSLLAAVINPEIKSHSITFTEAVFHCHCFLKSVQELLFKHDSFGTFPGKVPQIPKGTHAVNLGQECGYTVSSYIKDMAHKRSTVIAQEICACVSNSLNKNDIGFESGSSEDVNNNTTSQSNYKKAIKVLRREYCKIVRSQTDYVCDFSSDLASLHSQGTFIERRNSAVKNKSLKSLDWFAEKNEPFNDAINKLYSEHLWNHVDSLMKNIYLASSSHNIVGRRISYSGKTNSIVLANCLAKLRGDEIPVGSIWAFSLILLVSFAYQNLQIWDHDFCKAMTSLPKDKFRYVSPNPSIPSSQTLKMMLDNQLKQNCIHSVFKTVLRGMVGEMNDGYSLGMFSGSVTVPLNIFLDFIANSLQAKRQQFLIAGNWEQFFVLTCADIHPIMKFLECVIKTLEKNFLTNTELFTGSDKQLKAKCATIQSFESSGFKMFFRVFRYRSRNCLDMHLPKGKVWRRRGSNCVVQEPNTYVNTIGNILFLPLLDSLNCLPKATWFDVVQKCIENFIRVLMDFLLDTQMMFSWCGANQLQVDFEHFLLWFEQDQFSQLWDEFREWQPIDAVKDMRSALVLLMCQPNGNQPSNQFRDMRESLSSISEASVDSFTGDQFDQAVLDIDLHDKERWLALRVKSNKKKFLCLS